jgi:hypothetical protein
MLQNLLPLLSVAVATALVAARPVLAEDKSHEGLVVSVAADKLTMTMTDGTQEHSHIVGKGAKIMLDGKTAKLDELKKGFHIEVTLDDQKKVTTIEAHSTAPEGG